MKSVLRGVLCGLVWMVAPAAWAQAEDVPVERSQGPVTDVTLIVNEGARAGEARTRPTVTRSPSRPVVELDAGRATGPIETLEVGSSGPTVDVGSITTGVQVDQEFLRRIAMVGTGVPIRMGAETEERINDVPEFVDVMSLRNAPLISLRTSRVPASEVMQSPRSDASGPGVQGSASRLSVAGGAGARDARAAPPRPRGGARLTDVDVEHHEALKRSDAPGVMRKP
ncbi:hypothetical protein [Myxococcus qinghaiensis]|uniref:hypothetical protein n=1 Tax=Myxococcus qinghaiensis TaxID=2906758 RepID=UPI0020A7F018|nr:hypothetical protein [Myxococcus qinghaiensis]MCP3165830.1 hypothetical protein [Myxococcus qinghaiensis]